MKSEGPVVSVVMSVYNGARYLPETIESVLAQTWSNFEFLIVNDGSSDKEVNAILGEFAVRDERVRTLSSDNEGLTRALAVACNLSRGRYIARIDVGDAMEPGRLAAQVRILETYPKCSLVSCAVSFSGPAWEFMWITDGKPSASKPACVLSAVADEGLHADIPHHGSVMMRRSAYEQVGGYREEFYYGQDWDLWYRLAETGEFMALRDVLYRARFFPEAISMTQSDRQRRMAKLSRRAHCLRKSGQSDKPVLDEARKVRPGSVDPARSRQALAAGHYFVGEALRRGGHRGCRVYLLESIKARPLSLKCWLRLVQSSLAR